MSVELPQDVARKMNRDLVVFSTDPEEQSEEKRRRDKVEAFHKLAMKRFETVMSAEKELRDEQHEDLRWRAGGDFQWDERTRADRQSSSRPYLTINRFPQAINQIVNAERESRGGIQVHPVDSGADIKTAEVFQGIIRHIEEKSSADAVYANGATWQATIGRGYWRVVTEPVHERTFDKHIRIKRIRNPFMVYCDPTADEPDFRDMRYAFIAVDMPRDQYEAQFGEEATASLEKFLTAQGAAKPDWEPEGSIRVSEYFYVDEVQDRLVQLMPVDETIFRHVQATRPELLEPILESDFPEEWNGKVPPGFEVVDERETLRRQVKWAIIDAEKILQGNDDLTEGQDWDGKWIPIVQVVGDEIDMDGTMDYRGVVRDGRDPQRVYNYEVTSLVETVQTGKTAPWIGYAGQFRGHEKKWNSANVKNWPYLEVEPVLIGGQPAPLPQRIVQEPPIMAIAQAIAQADNDFKVTTRWHDASLGQRGPQESGIAIERRQRQDQQSNAHYPDNMNRAKKFTGDILVDLIPKTYDTPRILKILGEDDKPRSVMVHGGSIAEGTEPPQGVDGIYDLSVGTYDVVVSIGPSYQTQRMETAEHLTNILSRQPDLFTMFADIYFENMESPVATRLAKRAKRLLPDQFQDDEEGMEDIPAGAARQIDQLTQQLQQATQQLEQAQQQLMIDAERAKAQQSVAETRAQADVMTTQAEVAGRERVEQLRAQTKLLEAQIRATSAASLEQVKAGLERKLAAIQAALENAASLRDAGLEQKLAATKTALDTARDLTTIEAESRANMREASHEHRLNPPTAVAPMRTPGQK